MAAHDATLDAVPAAALKAFGDRFGGRLFEPSSAGYDEARTIWNGAIDRRPGLIARCADASDVVAAVRFALEHDLRSYTIAFQLGGAMARVGEPETGYGRRAAGFDVNVNAVWLPEEHGDGPKHVGWVRSLFGDLEPMARGVYVNFLGEEGQDRVRSAYGPGTYDRLAKLKARTDPTNLFRFNQNVLPAS